MLNFTNPREMLPYLIVEKLRRLGEISEKVPYERKAGHAYYLVLRQMDEELSLMRKYMKIKDGDGKIWAYEDVIKQIENGVMENWENVLARDYRPFMEFNYLWLRLISSSFAHLKLVPSTKINYVPGTNKPDTIGMDEEEEQLEDETDEEEEDGDEDRPSVPNIPKSEPIPSPDPPKGPRFILPK